MRLVFASLVRATLTVATATILTLTYAVVGEDMFVTLATYDDYKLEARGWKLSPEFACLAWNRDESKEWGAKYGWVAYCLPNQISIGEYGFCGACLRIQNQQTGDYITARIVDQCSKPKGRLVLDYKTVFEPIDDHKTRIGEKIGQIFVEYHFVSCYQ
ncbi:PR4B [Linum grandiflorum]